MVTLSENSLHEASKSASERNRSPENTGGATEGNVRTLPCSGGTPPPSFGDAAALSDGETYPSSVLIVDVGFGFSEVAAGRGAVAVAGVGVVGFGVEGKFHATVTASRPGWSACFSWPSTLVRRSAPPVTKHAVPFPARAIPSTRWWLTERPTPTEKTRVLEDAVPARFRTRSKTAASLETCPSVRMNTCFSRAEPPSPNHEDFSASACCSGCRISVPPKSARIACASFVACSSVLSE
mmetsp:Transcript_50047/g.119074  ORF Transcript_50047/g.119074 Transcript_50047/m.119074 type:complete len:238 (-) Transcript_50047:1183-1896(-)